MSYILRKYLRNVTRFVMLTDLFLRNHRKALVCTAKVASRRGDPVGPTSGRFRGRRYQFELITPRVSSFILTKFLQIYSLLLSTLLVYWF